MLYSFYEETPEEILDETDVDSYFYHNIFDIPQSQHQIVRFSRRSNKKILCNQFVQSYDLKKRQRFIVPEEVNISKGELFCLVDSLLDFLKIFDHASKCKEIPVAKPKIEIASTRSKNNLFAHYHNDIIEHPNRQIRLSSPFGNNNSCAFSIKIFELHGNQFILRETVNLNHRENYHLYKNWDYVAKQVWNNWEQLRSVVHSTLIAGMTIALLFSLGTCIVQVKSVRVNFVCTKRLFNLLAERLSMINDRNARLCARCAIFLWRSNKFLFLVGWSRSLHFWREPKISSRCYWRYLLSWQVLFQQREMRISWWLCNNFEIHLCL